MDTRRARCGLGRVRAWLENQGLPEESLRASVMGLGIEIFGALCARAEPAPVRDRFRALSARMFTFTMFAELCRYMESFRARRRSERTVVSRRGKYVEETGGPDEVLWIEDEDEDLWIEDEDEDSVGAEDGRVSEDGEQENPIVNFPCTLCSQVFNTKETLMGHSERHRRVSRDKKYKCSDCSYTTCYKKTLANHTRTHTKERPYSCSVCDKGFNYLSEFTKHVRIHTGERPYTCTVCGKRFIQLVHCQIHMRIHTGERPYSCEFCVKAFSNISSLKNHKRIHTGERPYICEVCGNKFSSSSILRKHAHIHSHKQPFTCSAKKKPYICSTEKQPYICSVCDKIFTYSSDCQKHERIHTGERPFLCFVCGKTFIQLVHCQIHMRIHTGERPYSCNVCAKSFSIYSALKRHTSVHTVEQLNSIKMGMDRSETDEAVKYVELNHNAKVTRKLKIYLFPIDFKTTAVMENNFRECLQVIPGNHNKQATTASRPSFGDDL
uniref:zinc finger protein 134-like n=1 Tax=Myxine glutinosa TaxID=7769 RepID=UPI0035900FB4